MKGVGPFTHTDPRDRPPEIFGGTNTLHFGAGSALLLLPSFRRVAILCRCARSLPSPGRGCDGAIRSRALPLPINRSVSMIRAAIVGLGAGARARHCGAGQERRHPLRRSPIPARARARRTSAARRACRSPTATTQILADPNVDAVVLATPHSQHERQMLQAAAAGKHIHVEKPITLDRAERRRRGRRRAQGRRRAGGRLLPAVPSLGGRGPQPSARTGGSARWSRWWRSTPPAPASSSRRTIGAPRPRRRRAARFTAIGVHSLDHMIEFAGRVRDVRCVTARHVPGHSDDTTTVMLHFESGATGLLFCSVATATNFCFTLYGSKGLAEISRPNLQRFRFVPTSTQRADRPGHRAARRGQRASRASTCSMPSSPRLRARSATGRPYPVPIEDVLHGMSVFDAIVRAAKSGQIEAVTDAKAQAR